MSFQTDFDPIIYLERRVKYYRKGLPHIKRMQTDEYTLEKYGKKVVERVLKNRYYRIAQYEKAIEILKRAK